MKALKLSSGIIVILAGCWVVASWYTGKKLESNLTAYSARITELANKGVDLFPKGQMVRKTSKISLSLRQVERGIFSSVVKGEINLMGEIIPVTYDVEHGPFPLSLLKQGNIQPKLAYMKVRIPKDSDFINDLSSYVVGDRDPIEITSVFGYDKQVMSKLIIAPIKMTELRDHLISDEIAMTLDVSPINGDIHFDLLFKKFDTEAPESSDRYFALKLDNLSITSNRVIKNNLPTGNATFLLSKFNVITKARDLLIEDVNYHNVNSQEQNTNLLTSTEDFTVKNITLNKVKLANITAKIKTEHLDLSDFKTLQNAYLLNKNKDTVWVSFLTTLLANEPIFTVSELQLTNEKGKITFDGSIQLNKLTRDEIENIIKSGGDKLKFVKQGNYHFFADADAVKHLFQFITDIDPLSMLDAAPLVVKKGNTFISDFSFTSPDKFIVNGNSMTRRDIMAMTNKSIAVEGKPAAEEKEEGEAEEEIDVENEASSTF